jgi:hypothetical protein
MTAFSVADDLLDLLERRRGAIVDDASRGLLARHLDRYDLVGEHEARLRLELLYARVVASIRLRTAEPMVDYAAELARRRFTTGYRLAFVQSAFDALEAAIWQAVSAELPCESHAAALGLVSAAVGAGKDALGWTYASLALRHQVEALDVDALFAGTDGPVGER